MSIINTCPERSIERIIEDSCKLLDRIMKPDNQIDESLEEFYAQEREDQAQQDYIWEMRNAEE